MNSQEASEQDHVYRRWERGLGYMASGDGDRALYVLEMLPRWPTISFNKAMIHMHLADPQAALGCLDEAVVAASSSSSSLLLPLAAFQRGVVRFRREEYGPALKDFSLAFHALHGRTVLDCRPAGLDYRLCASAVLFNAAMSQIHMGQFDEGARLLAEARRREPSGDEGWAKWRYVFEVSPDAAEQQQQGPGQAGADYWRVFEVPPGRLCRPPSLPRRRPAAVPPSTPRLSPSVPSSSSSFSSSSSSSSDDEEEHCPSTPDPPRPGAPLLRKLRAQLAAPKRPFFSGSPLSFHRRPA